MAEKPASIRLATVADAHPVADLGARTFFEAFAAQNSAEDVEAYIAENFHPSRVAEELGDPLNRFLLAFDGRNSAPVGYAKLRAGPPDTAVTGEHPVELERIYLTPATIGRGIGAALMRSCLDAAAGDGFGTIWLGVWEHNARAIEFYRRWGFETVGAHAFMLGADEQTDLVMQRSVQL